VADAQKKPELVVAPEPAVNEPESGYIFGLGEQNADPKGDAAVLSGQLQPSVEGTLPSQLQLKAADSQPSELQLNAGQTVAGPMHMSATEGPARSSDVGINMPPGTLFDEKYEILEVLGEGGMSVVYKARHVLMKNIVAIKLLKARYASDSATMLRFQREGQAVSRLNHPSIVRVYDFGISREGHPFLVMEYFEGQSLLALIAEKGPLPLNKAVSIYSQVARALASAHTNTVIHRDLKPSNIVVLDPESPTPTVKIVDFGLAKVFDEEEAGQHKLTQTGDIFGSPSYMSPEQCQGKKVDDRSDMYSMGCLMYEGLTGDLPFRGENLFLVFKKHVEDTPRNFKAVAPQLKDLALIEPVVFKCLAKAPSDRYQTMDQLAQALDAIKDGGTTGSALAGNIKTMAIVQREKFKAVSLRRAFSMALLIVITAGLVGTFFAKNGRADIPITSPGAQACFDMDVGQYKRANAEFAGMLSEAKRNNLNESVVRFLGDDAVLKHILGDKSGEVSDDQTVAAIESAGGDRSAVEESTMQLIDVLLAGGKSAPERESALAKPVDKMIVLAQNLAWSQEDKSAQRIMSGLIERLSGKLSAKSALLLNVKAYYASMLLQKIVNPACPFTPGEREDVINRSKALLQERLELGGSGSGGDLWLVRCNLALAQALSGQGNDADKIRQDLLAAYRKGLIVGKDRALIEARLADIAVALNKPNHAINMYKRAYQRFFSDRQYPQAAYCIGAFSRSCWLSGHLRERYEFLTARLKRADVAAPEASIVKAEVQSWLSELQLWLATSDPSVIQVYFRSPTVHGKSQHDLLIEAEHLALESFVSIQNSRPSKLWLANSAVDTLVRIYFNSNSIGKAVPILRLKLAVAERTSNIKAADEARNNLGAALLAYSKNPPAQTLFWYDNGQITLGRIGPLAEAQSLYQESFRRVTAGGADAVFWLDEWFPDLAGEFATTQPEKDKLLLACRTSCDNVAKIYGKNSLEYMIQLRWKGRLAWQLGEKALARESLTRARDLAFANDALPMIERRALYSDLSYVCRGLGDTAAAQKYNDEMNSLTAPQ